MKASALLLQVSIVLAYLAFNEVLSQPCPQRWLLHGDNCYYFAPIRRSWYQAKSICEGATAKLVVIEDVEERKWLESSIKKAYWIGLTDRRKEREWEWINGSPLNYNIANWGRNKPNNRRKQDCAVIRKRHRGWNDLRCKRKRRYICKRPANDDAV